MQPYLLFKLDQNRDARGLRCDDDGLFLADHPLLRKDKRGGFEARPPAELQSVFNRVYGRDTDWDSRIRSVRLVASALNKGDMARATMTAVLMRLPDPGSSVRMADVDGVLAKAGFDPDEPRDEQGRWTTDGVGTAEPHATGHDARIQLADDAMSDAVNDPVVEAARRAAVTQRNLQTNESRDEPAAAAHENLWEALGSRISDEVKSALSRVGRAEVAASNANLAAATEQANTVAHALKAYADYRAQPWIGRNGKPVEVPTINTGDPLSDRAALIGHDLFEASTPLMRPATNADWIDALINTISAGAAAAGPALRLLGRGTTAVADIPELVTPEADALIGRSGFRGMGKFTEAVTVKYQGFYDQGYVNVMDSVSQGLVPKNPLVIGSKTDLFARTALRDWLSNVEGIEEGPGRIIRVNRRLYDPLGSGKYRVPDVHIPGTKTILDGSLQFKTSTLPQIVDYRAFSGGANILIVRPSTAPTDPLVGSYGIVH